MDKRTLSEFITAWVLILYSCLVLALPIFNFDNIKVVFLSILIVYCISHLIKNIVIFKFKDYSGFSTTFNCIIVFILSIFLDANEPWNLALLLFSWIILMSLTKLKESDYYHDRKNKLWKLNICNLVLFILIGILTTINLYYPANIQILVIGFFFLSHGILELMDPLVAYIIEKN